MNLPMERGSSVMEMSEEELVSVLQNSIYPGAKLESIKMVIGYCKAAGLDPIQKPVHIVPMQVATGEKDNKGWDIKEWRDVVMPGIGLYRTQAARNGHLAGIEEPEFGPTTTVAGVEVPEWCRVTVYRMVAGEPRAFTALEYWVENYATKGRDSDAPNAMWRKRPRGQLAKCAEAQALRKAFPEVGAQPTAEEMEGKVLDGEFEREPTAAAGFKVGKRQALESTGTTIDQPAESPEPEPAQQRTSSKKASKEAAAEPAPQGEVFVGIGEQKYLQNKASAIGADLDAVLADLGGLVLEKLTKADFEQVKRYLLDLGG